MKQPLIAIIVVVGLMISCNKGADASQVKLDKKVIMEREVRMNELKDGLYANIQTTKGDIWVELFYKQAPLTVINFAGLAEGSMSKANKSGAFYDGVSFHRVIKDFMIQGGDPEGTGMGGPGYRFGDEFDPELRFDRPGLLAMANAGAGTNGSQFFITHVPTPHLNDKHTIFGQVVSSADQDVVNKIVQGDKIVHVEIVRKGQEAENFVISQASFDALTVELEKAEQASSRLYNEEMEKLALQKMPNAQRSTKGAYYIVERQGSGAVPTVGSTVQMHYEGRFLVNQELFDSSYTRGEPLAVPAGAGMVIEGWDEMIMEMKVGEKRLVILPYTLAYGELGYPGAIPPKAWLEFSMERIS